MELRAESLRHRLRVEDVGFRFEGSQLRAYDVTRRLKTLKFSFHLQMSALST